ncbi:MAG: hypothetical protein ACLQMF_14545 [Rectinemataceae bacterium]
MATKTYRCKDCGSEVIVDERSGAPDCCGQTMEQLPLEPCTSPSAAEARRTNIIDDACDDGVR